MGNQDNRCVRFDVQALEKAWAAYYKALEILNQPKPDTFLGRRTFEPFPKERS